MIVVHRLTHPDQPLHLNPDLIQSVEAHPDTVIVLNSAAKFVVGETPEQITQLIRDWRASIVAQALASAGEQAETDASAPAGKLVRIAP
jgi:flagellar protein FlbD